MIELEIQEKTYKIPTELSVKKYMKLIKTEGITTNPVKLLSVYTDIEEDIIKRADIDNVNFILSFIQSKYTNKESKVMATFEWEGKKYGLQQNIKEMNFGGWVDLEMAVAEGVEKNIDTILSILYRPLKWTKGSKYEIEEYDGESAKERKEIFGELPIDYWFGVSQFFFYLGKASLEITQDYLISQNQMMKKQLIWMIRKQKLMNLLQFWK
jgi:hypothetical protein